MLISDIGDILEYILEKAMRSLGVFSERFDLYAALVSTIFFISVLITIYITFKMEKNRLYFAFIFVLATTTLWIYADLYKYLSTNMDSLLFWIRIEYFARLLSAPAWFTFGELYTKRHDKLNQKRFFVILAISMIMYSGFYFKNFGITPARTLYSNEFSLYIGYIIVSCIIFYNLIKLNKFAHRQKGVFTKQVQLITVGLIFIFLFDVISFFRLLDTNIDIVPFGFIMFDILFWFAITKYRLLEIIPIALREVFNNMNDGVIVLNEDGNIIDINNTAKDYLNFYFNPKIDISITDIILNLTTKIDNAPILLASFKDVIKNPSKSYFTEITLKSNTPRYFSISIGPIFDNKKRPIGYLVSIINITEYKKLLHKNEEQNIQLHEQNEELEAQKEELEAQKLELIEVNQQLEQAYSDVQEAQSQMIQSEKMAALGQLVAGIAHEINTPLGSINSNIEITKLISDKLIKISSACDNEEVDKLITKFNKINEINAIACKRILDIVRTLKNFSRLDEAEFQKASIHDGIDSTLILLNNQLKNRITIHKNYGDIPEIECYPNQLNQVFMNILVNASQAIEDTGDIYIETYLKDSTVYIEFTDTGKGIKKEHINKVFDPGFTTKGVGIGTGLGLSITYKIIEKHNGKIYAANTEDKGARFTIQLPVMNNLKQLLKSEV